MAIRVLLTLGVLQPDGLIVFSCCQGQLSTEKFFSAIHQAAAKAGRPLRKIKCTTHTLDQPIHFKEGTYLKALFATILQRGQANQNKDASRLT